MTLRNVIGLKPRPRLRLLQATLPPAYLSGLTRPLSWRQIKGVLRGMGSKKVFPGLGCLLAVIVFSFAAALLLYWVGP